MNFFQNPARFGVHLKTTGEKEGKKNICSICSGSDTVPKPAASRRSQTGNVPTSGYIRTIVENVELYKYVTTAMQQEQCERSSRKENNGPHGEIESEFQKGKPEAVYGPSSRSMH
ncbi:hypothetical protein TNCT_529861 [Trichonephila clavata]|uniref:Uncharacterized protein n=1 Tax=Trichonephila clavata TaxID=2740835 RepID=A0A8X6IC99_TRICU|nr:hypothetical protein TNCT_529861 [Trichonephila clavata]